MLQADIQSTWGSKHSSCGPVMPEVYPEAHNGSPHFCAPAHWRAQFPGLPRRESAKVYSEALVELTWTNSFRFFVDCKKCLV